MSIQTPEQRIVELLNLRRKIDTELGRLSILAGIAKKTKRSKFDIPECGSETAWQRHRYYDQPIDEACRLAHNTHERTRAALARERKRAERLAELMRRAA